MTENYFFEKFLEQFEESDLSQITIDSEFRSIEEWSSMMALVIIAMVDEEFGITITGDDIRKSVTIRDVYNVVAARKTAV